LADNLNAIWESLKKDIGDTGLDKSLILRRLRPVGLHIGIDLSNRQRVLLLEIKSSNVININKLPRWKGVELSVRNLSDNREAILLKLKDSEGITIFNALIKDIYESLEEVNDAQKALELFKECLNIWSDFFIYYGYEGLGQERQRGLFGELFFLKKYVLINTDYITGINFWRGHSRKYQDFSFPNGNIEIKTTIKKEHKTVIITSEKQLDNTGLNSLYLYCLAMNVTEQKEYSLPELIKEIRRKITSTSNALKLFNRYLNNAGYLDEHEQNYENERYAIKKEYFFKVTEGFPRIIELPRGVGDLKYSIVLSACKDYEANIEKAIDQLLGEMKSGF